ncbi:hypothetical protein UFOVP703_78 [uncultured Caudovirales phage]|uniref:Uncharacterized protein n=1 Tax=uncultured Caudovirales phage TaxID=2100421 RepID=A0A6J5NQ51_9CAUD|nr:hypothetical protein UFOVP703_78 [uncultured Caudovirales phage]
MAKTPLLRFVGCARGKDAAAYRAAKRQRPDWFEPIKMGPLRGCVRHLSNIGRPTVVLKFGRGYVLQFRVVIRPGHPEELRGG